jgi:hemolysin activation/secretion protein
MELRSSYEKIPLIKHGQWQVVGFADAGHTWTEQVQTDTPVAVGTGIRLQFGTWGQVRCDAAWPLTDGLAPRVHLNLTVFF